MQIFVMSSERRVCNVTERTIIAVQGHSGSNKVVDFSANRKRVFDFY